MNNRRSITLLLLIGWCAMAAGFAKATTAQAPSCTDLLLKKCEECHYLSRVCQKLGQKSKWKWKRTMKAMIRHGAKINQDEQELLIDCLTDNGDAAKAACQAPTSTKPYIRPLEKMSLPEASGK